MNVSEKYFLANLSERTSSVLSTVFDVGGIFGGIIAGVFSDNTGMSATTCTFMLIVSVPLVSIKLFSALFFFSFDLII